MLTRCWVEHRGKRRGAVGNGGKRPGRTGAYGADPSGASANVSVSAGRTRVRTGRYHPGSYRPHLSRHTSPPLPPPRALAGRAVGYALAPADATRRLVADNVDAGVPSGGQRFSRRAKAEASGLAASRPARKEKGAGEREPKCTIEHRISVRCVLTLSNTATLIKETNSDKPLRGIIVARYINITRRKFRCFWNSCKNYCYVYIFTLHFYFPSFFLHEINSD